VRRSVSGRGKKTASGMKAALLSAGVLAAAGAVFYFATSADGVKANGTMAGTQASPTLVAASMAKPESKPVPNSLSLPMFFEPNQGQTAPEVKFLARGAGYGLFLTADEAVLELQQAAPNPRMAAAFPQAEPNSWIRMRLEGANPSAKVAGASPLRGKSNYFIGNDPSKWRHDIPQFARVQYQSVYPGVDLVYYGHQGQLEYDFRVAPGAEPSQIALSFAGASARIDAGDSGDLVLSTANGEIRFRAPHVYQQESGTAEKTVAGSFRQLADNKIGFSIGDYDRSRELIIDPVLAYSTFLGAGGESLVRVAIDSANNIYLAGSTTSAYFFPVPGAGTIPPLQDTLNGKKNLFIAEIDPTPAAGDPELLFATYLGGSETDSLAGLAVDSGRNIYVAGTTFSPDFPHTSNAFQTSATFGVNQTHGFLTAITFNSNNNVYSLGYSTFLAGDGTDTVTGLAIDTSCNPTCNAYVTGVTTSQDGPTNGFPANAAGFQKNSNSPGNAQFFASKIFTGGNGSQSMLYSTYFGGGNFGTTDIAIGGGIAVDPPPNSSPNMYFTGTTNMLGVTVGSLVGFPLFNAQQTCLNEASKTLCTSQNPTNTTDAFVAKINPNQAGSSPLYSTYLGGSGSDFGNGVAVDSSANTYVVGATSSNDWLNAGGGFQLTYNGLNGATNAFLAKVSNNLSGTNQIIYFTYLGGSGPDSAQDVRVDSTGAAYIVGTTSSPASDPFPVTPNTLQPVYGGGNSDAFVAFIATSLPGQVPGDYSSYLGGGGTDQGTGIAFDVFGSAYVAGTTQSANFPITPATAFQNHLIVPQDAFVSKIGANSVLTLTVPNTSPSPNPVAAGNPITFTFNINNTGPDNARLVVFNALGLPTSGTTNMHATVTSGSGSCGSLQGSTISCNIPELAANATAAVQVSLTPTIPVQNPTITISGNASANGGAITASATQPTANVTDFNINALALTPTVNAGDTAQIQIKFCPTPQSMPFGYHGTITPSETINPSMVTSSIAFNPTTVILAGTDCGTTTLSLATVARPLNVSSLRSRRSWFYAAWLPIGGVSLIGLGIGASRKRRLWLLGALLGLIAGILLLQPGCGSASTATPTNTGTAAGTYTVNITGSAGTNASHATSVPVQVN
jgi:hypothetical protein